MGGTRRIKTLAGGSFESLEARVLFSAASPAAPVNEPSALVSTAFDTSSARHPSVYAWSQPAVTTSFQMYVVANRYTDPVAEARRIAPLLQARSAGQRVLGIAYPMDQTLRSLDLDHPATFIANGLDTADDHAWSTAFFTELKACDAPLERVVIDVEAGFDTWNLLKDISDESVQIMQSIYDDPGAYAKLPSDVKQFQPQDYRNFLSKLGRAAYIAWNRFAQSFFHQAVQDAVFNPLHDAFGPDVLAGNYGESAPTRQLLDRNGWPMAGPNRAISGNLSSPELYLSIGNASLYREKDWRWNRLIDALNVARGCISDSGTPITPWVSYPTYRGDNAPVARSTWLWEQLIRHLAACGVSSFYYFNPTGATPSADDAFANRLFNAVTVGEPSEADLRPIPFDADEIVTGGIVTSYAEFLRMVDRPGSSSVFATIQPPGMPNPSSQVSATLHAGKLTVTGSDRADRVMIVESASRIFVYSSGVRIGNFARVNQIYVLGGKGADLIELQITNSAITAKICGGAGNDTLKSSAGNDTICGDAGNDRIQAGLGTNQIDGGEGDDLLYRECLSDSIIGDTGINTIRTRLIKQVV